MSDECQFSFSLSITKGNLNYRPQNPSFNVNVTGQKGPSPGAISVPTTGVDVDLSQLVTPGLCILRNLDQTNFFEYGIRDPVTSEFFPLGEVLPGQSWPLLLSRNLLEAYTNTGTGTTGQIKKFHLKADTAALYASVEAFEK